MLLFFLGGIAMQKHENKTQTVVLSKHPNRFKGEIEDLRGKRFGELTVINFDKKDHLGRAKWLCRCSCGKMTSVLGYHLKAGAIKKPITSRRSKFYGCLFKYATSHETDIPLTK